MRYIKYLLISAAIVVCNVALAEPVTTSVTLPFYYQSIDANNKLSFHYDLTGSTAKKIVCDFTNVKNVWLEGSGLATNPSPTYSGGNFGDIALILNSKGNTAEITDSIVTKEEIAVNNLEGDIIINTDSDLFAHVRASCYYDENENNKK